MVHDFKQSLEGSLVGNLLVAMPQMRDSRFIHGVILICGHDDKGAMGLVINKHMESFFLSELLNQLGIPMIFQSPQEPVHYGGPVEVGRGFVLHSTDVMKEGSVSINSWLALSATMDILTHMAQGSGPKKRLCALGYAGWGAGQLENEIQENAWLVVPAQEHILFDAPDDEKWFLALKSLGIKPDVLSLELGHA
jgi:putative transcriptional regulator